MSKPLAYSYIRMSTELQLKGDSLRRQMELSEQYVQEHGLELVSDVDLHDIGVSAFKGANVVKGALGRFLDAIKKNEVPKGSYLLVESLDRLTRQDINSSVALFLEITRSGVNIVTLADRHIYKAESTDFTQLIYSIVVMARANDESAIKSSRIGEAWNNKRAQIGVRKLTKWSPAWLQLSEDRSCFEQIPDRVETVRRIYRSAAAGQGSGIITRLLNNDGVPAFGKSNGWLDSYVSKILTNRSVLGEFQPHKRIDGKRVPTGHVIKDYYPRIIAEDLFLKVQAGRRERTISGSGRRGPKQRNLFTNIVKCRYCGSSMRFVNKGNGPKGGKYLRCSASVRGMDCVATAWKYDDFEKSVFSFVREFDLRAVVEDSHKRSEAISLREKRSILEERLGSRQVERQRVFDLLIGGNVAANEYLQAQLNSISEEIESIQDELTSTADQIDCLPSSPVARIDTGLQLAALRQLSAEGGFRDRLLVSTKLRELIKEIVISTEGIGPNFNAAKALVEMSGYEPEFQTKLLDELKRSHFSGPRSNPHFTVFFHNATSRVVIPEQKDPTRLIWQADQDGAEAIVKDRSGEIMMSFGPKLQRSDFIE